MYEYEEQNKKGYIISAILILLLIATAVMGYKKVI